MKAILALLLAASAVRLYDDPPRGKVYRNAKPINVDIDAAANAADNSNKNQVVDRNNVDMCIVEGHACNAREPAVNVLDPEYEAETNAKLDAEHEAEEELEASKEGAGSESEQPSKGT